MFKPLACFIGLRYTRAKKRNHFVSFISLVSLLGIALGVMVLITVLSVMNGFDTQIRDRMLVMVPQVTVSEWGGPLHNWQGLKKRLSTNKTIVGMAPFVQGQGLINGNGGSAFSVIEGIDPKQQNQISPIAHKLIAGTLSSLTPGSYNIVLGKVLAQNLGVTVGNKVTLVVPQTTASPIGLLPRLKQFKIMGIFSVGYQYDQSIALTNIHDAATLMNLPAGAVTGLQLKLTNLFLAGNVVHHLNGTLPAYYQASDWMQQNANFFAALKMEKTMMFLILVLIIAVAAFNMLASLVMVVTDKQSDIAILRTLGASTRTIMGVFMVQGIAVGVVGILLGIVAGVILSLNVTALVDWIQHLLHVQFLNPSVYFISYLPSKLSGADIWHVSLVAFVLSVLATLYPAWRASKVIPAEALRYE